MSSVKLPRVQLILGDALLVAGVFVPWMILTSSTFGLPPVQDFSPGNILWSAIFATPTIVSGPEVVGLSLIYLSAAAIVVGFSAPYILRSVNTSRAATWDAIAYIALAGATVCGLCGLFGLALPVGFELGSPYPDVSLFFGVPLVLVGALLTFVAVLNVRFRGV